MELTGQQRTCLRRLYDHGEKPWGGAEERLLQLGLIHRASSRQGYTVTAKGKEILGVKDERHVSHKVLAPEEGKRDG